jgi:hypothetical protein
VGDRVNTAGFLDPFFWLQFYKRKSKCSHVRLCGHVAKNKKPMKPNHDDIFVMI